MDPEFQRAMIVVSAIGLTIAVIGTIALVFIFRAFGGKQAGSKVHIGLIAGLVAFVFACCLALFALSYR